MILSHGENGLAAIKRTIVPQKTVKVNTYATANDYNYDNNMKNANNESGLVWFGSKGLNNSPRYYRLRLESPPLPFPSLLMGLPSSCPFPPARRWAPTAGLLFFPDKRQFHSPPSVRCVHIPLPPWCQNPLSDSNSIWVSYRCLSELWLSAGFHTIYYIAVCSVIQKLYFMQLCLNKF